MNILQSLAQRYNGRYYATLLNINYQFYFMVLFYSQTRRHVINRLSSRVADFITRNKLLTQKLLKQGYRYHKLRKTVSKFFRQYYDLISKFQVGLK